MKNDLNVSIVEAFLNRLELGISENQSLEFLPNWLVRNTGHPTIPKAKMSFKDHEFQIDIVKSTAHKQSTIKISQAGMTEASIRKALGLATLRQKVHLIYTLPTASFARKIAKTRVDTIIEQSPIMSSMLDKNVDSTEIKRLGDSFVYFQGTFSEKSAISVPASYVISDEVDFSDQDVLSDYKSRLGHQDEDESFIARFSTPTVDGFSISEDYSASSQGHYAVKCLCCNTWQTPGFLEHVVIPDIDMGVPDLTREYALEHKDKGVFDNAYVYCPNCKKDLWESLCDPSRRAWVHAYPQRVKDHEGFRVTPFDVPRINSVTKTLKEITEYRRLASWYNYKLGLTYSDNTNKFNTDITRRNITLTYGEGATGLCMGVDIGKQTWVIVGKPYYDPLTHQVNGADILFYGRIDHTKLGIGETIGSEIIKVQNKYGVISSVIDAAPDFTTAKIVKDNQQKGATYGAYYTGEATFSKKMTYYEVKDSLHTVNAARTSSLDLVCEINNRGGFKFVKSPESDTLLSHLSAVSRVEPENMPTEPRWVKIGNRDDHYVHALNYFCLAADISHNRDPGDVSISLPLTLSKVNIANVNDRGINLTNRRPYGQQ